MQPERRADAPPAEGLMRVFDLHRMELLRFLVARCGEIGEAEDCLHDLWLRIAGMRGGVITQPRAYLFRMANNVVLDRRRGQTRAMARDRGWIEADGTILADAAPDPAPRADEALIDAEDTARLLRAMAQLPAGAGRALHLHRIEEHPQADVARIMGISRSGVEKHIATALRHLRRILQAEGAPDCGGTSPAASPEQPERLPARLDDQP